MIGLILWAIVIIIIAEAVCPGLIWITLGTLAVVWGIYFGIYMLIEKLKDRK